MQTLSFEPAWDKTISEQDRKIILEKFRGMVEEAGLGVSFNYLWHAYNHRNALLITVLIHNGSSNLISISNRMVKCYYNEGKEIASHEFTLPFRIPAHTSMPWTFIFPEETVTNHNLEELENGIMALNFH